MMPRLLAIFIAVTALSATVYAGNPRARKHQLKQWISVEDVQAEIDFGREVAARIIARYSLYDNKELTKYLNLVLKSLAQYSNRPELTFTVGIIDTDIINAFAAPGGVILVTKGAISAMRDEAELADMLVTALALKGPAAIRYPRGHGYGVQRGKPKRIRLGRAEVLEEGKDGLIVAVGSRVRDALEAVETLRREDGKHLTLINLRFIKPLDEQTILAHIQPEKPLLVVEEGCRQGGIGEAIGRLVLENGWQGAFAHLGIGDVFPQHGSQEEILHDLELDAEAITARLRGMF